MWPIFYFATELKCAIMILLDDSGVRVWLVLSLFVEVSGHGFLADFNWEDINA